MLRSDVRWSVVPTGGVAVQPRRPPGIEMRLLADGVEIGHHGSADVRLPWEAYGDAHNWSAAFNRWEFTIATKVGGLSAVVVGEAASSARRLYAESKLSRFLRVDNAMLLDVGAPVVVIAPRALVGISSWPHAPLFRAFAEVMCNLPQLREALSDLHRCTRLASDMASFHLGDPTAAVSLRRDSLDVATAIRACGYVHRFRRPLDRVDLPPLGSAVAEVSECLRSSASRAGRSIDRARVEAILRRNYFEVEPWPFAALCA